ncbi:granzyme A-like isoform X2 [Numida meleagris]|uniref:granzyme A-like isoform X2 n=1 Tax=Numida meleagris TaxID=8996 RepID=UPI000B3DC6CA|nr:granzyme A-like isoform X2 [Numida meleagris]XP_021237117.1 granzyme A-like isoform X2 [Numida meleagris]XP_021237119.1 granzyme A-like isoform X2 [Numida meleagris]
MILICINGCSDIIGGHCVRAHSRPFMAAIRRMNITVCGGVLVGRQWVLTAAHCNYRLEESDTRVVLGAHQASKAEKEQQRFKIMRFFSHPQYNRSSKENDIMLLKLDRMANLNKYVQLFPLPDTGEDIKPGTKCSVTGWGRTSSGKLSKCLREATVEIVDRKVCERKYNKKQKPVNITRNMLCAGGKMRFSKRDACQGDSGGPLICGRKFSGIVSFGEKCGIGDRPGVYTRLTEKYINWIKKTVSRNGEA